MKKLMLALILCFASVTSSTAQDQQPQGEPGLSLILQVNCLPSAVLPQMNALVGFKPAYRGLTNVTAFAPTGGTMPLQAPMMILTNPDDGTYSFVMFFGEQLEIVCPLTGGTEFSEFE